jgi:hypothetical protein
MVRNGSSMKSFGSDHMYESQGILGYSYEIIFNIFIMHGVNVYKNDLDKLDRHACISCSLCFENCKQGKLLTWILIKKHVFRIIA